MLKQDGHTHTEFCQHGSGDDCEKMIQKAIQMGFQAYTITEHAPLPPDFRKELGGDLDGFDTGAMDLKDLDAYFKKAQAMRAKYASDIRIKIGFEFDFLPTQINWTKDFLKAYGHYLDDGILSVHFMKGKNNQFWDVDLDTQEFETGLLSIVTDPQVLYGHYLDALKVAVTTDLGPHAPKRLGHMTLIKKYQDYFHLPLKFNAENLHKVADLFVILKAQNWSLDFNAAGLYKPWCNESYPYPDLIKMAQAFQIPLVYGSDAHSVAEIGHGYHALESFLI